MHVTAPAVLGNQRIVPFEHAASCDLVVDALYRGGTAGNTGDDPINRMLGVGNMGGFRFVGKVDPFAVPLCVLYSDLADPDWPDELDYSTGTFTYYGDNKKPGHLLHPGARHGNAILRESFDRLHTRQYRNIPLFFVFTKSGHGRDVVFRGLAVPGAASMSQTDDLVAIWKSRGHQRFQNYRAYFTILDIPAIPRQWLEDIALGNATSSNAPANWRQWVDHGRYIPLQAAPSKKERSRSQQLPADSEGIAVLDALIQHCKEHAAREFAFEPIAAEIVKFMDGNVGEVNLTKPWRDGGRDAIGTYLIGLPGTRVEVEFAMEAKCYSPTNAVGVKATSRLISRLRHRQFGVLVTTSYLHKQAYMELIDDGHPVIILAGADIVSILKGRGISSPVTAKAWASNVTKGFAI